MTRSGTRGSHFLRCDRLFNYLVGAYLDRRQHAETDRHCGHLRCRNSAAHNARGAVNQGPPQSLAL
jgi:hypothetical protein